LLTSDLSQAIQETEVVVFADDTDILLTENKESHLETKNCKSYKTIRKSIFDK
jgi:glucosamine 6-phosphate synthetase-like amidotransferase/phosphosugar isomerase protein